MFFFYIVFGKREDVYKRQDLGIALSDTYTSGIFLSNLSRKQAKLFDGVRCDSGNEFRFIDSLDVYKRQRPDYPTEL